METPYVTNAHTNFANPEPATSVAEKVRSTSEMKMVAVTAMCVGGERGRTKSAAYVEKQDALLGDCRKVRFVVTAWAQDRSISLG